MNVPIVALLLLAAACSSGSSHSAAAPSAAPSGLPVVSETFTALPCDDTTDVGEEGCQEKAALAADAQVNTLVKALWTATDAAGKAKVEKAERDWIAYRTSFCALEKDAYRDGTEGPVVFAQCLADLTQQHVADLKTANPNG